MRSLRRGTTTEHGVSASNGRPTLRRAVEALGVSLLLALLVAVAAGPASADFINGGFENGTFSGWTLGGGTWEESPQGSGIVVYHETGDPGKSAIVGTGFDALTNNHLSTVYNGNYAARVNNFDPNYHYTTLEQQITGWDQDSIYFAWAAVLEEPDNAHGVAAAPHFSLTLTDITRNMVLYQQAFTVYDAPGGAGTWHVGAPTDLGNWLYTDWVVANLDTSAYRGDDFSMSVAAFDCGWSGHGGYAYVDTFGPAPPEQTGTPEPGTLLLCSLGIVGYGGRVWKRRRASPSAG